MAELFRSPLDQLENSAGVPVSGGKLYFYQAGTTTDLTVYQEIGLSTPHAQPVVADASGIFPAIYLGTSTYKVEYKTAADVLIKSYDNINGTSASGTVLDGTFRVQNSSDNTKQLAFDASGITSGNTRTLTAPNANGTIALRSDLASSTYEATTSAYGVVKKASLAQTLAGTPTGLVPTIDNLYLPTGFLYGLTLANGTDATNDINIAAGSARDATDSYNFLLGSTYVKQIDAAWALGSAAGGLDTGSVADTRYAIWGIGRSDTRVCDVLFSTSFSAPTMPSNYDFKVLIGEFTRTGGTNGTPLWYGPRRASTGYAGITLGQSVASTSGTSIPFTGIPAWAKRITIQFAGVSTSGSSLPMVQIGPAGGVETSGYLGSAATVANAAASAGSNGTTGFLVLGSMASGIVFHGTMALTLCDPSTNTWVASVAMGRSDAGSAVVGGASKSLAGVLTQLAITTVGGTDTFDLGKVNILYE